MDRPLIFITNDDGYQAKGLRCLIDMMRPLGRILVVAPEVGQSGKSHAITMSQPIYMRLVEEDDDVTIYTCSGTPVDCVKVTFDYLLKDQRLPDLALSGINHGANSGVNVLYSGTMGAAMEESFYNIPTVGVSLLSHDEDADFSSIPSFVLPIIERVMRGEAGIPVCLNINVPDLPHGQIRGVKFCRQTRGFWREDFEKRQDPRGRDYYWLSGYFVNTEPDAVDTDEWALKNDYIAVVPVQVDQTNYTQLRQLQAWNTQCSE
ncbi:MAG: 5'/3'-nucleotidase SurE [Alistipes sp.]|nr:5'/3'-nucleotidase SurE [Alistipes sp.]